MKKDNRGMTFIELIIVVALMSVIVGVSIYGLGLVSGKPAEECAQKIVYSLNNARTEAMGKYSTTYQLYKDGTSGMIMMRKIVYTDATSLPIETVATLGGDEVAVKCKFEGGGEVPFVNGTIVELSFDRSTGGFNATPSGNCVGIIVSKGSTTKKIALIPPTGKVYIE